MLFFLRPEDCKAQTENPWCSSHLQTPDAHGIIWSLGSSPSPSLSLPLPGVGLVPSRAPRSDPWQGSDGWPWASRWKGRGAAPAPQESRKDTESPGWESRIRAGSQCPGCSIPTGLWNNERCLPNQRIPKRPKSSSSCIPRTAWEPLKTALKAGLPQEFNPGSQGIISSRDSELPQVPASPTLGLQQAGLAEPGPARGAIPFSWT